MLANTSDIYALSAAHRRHADDLTVVAAGLTAAHASPDAFGSIGAGFLSALNEALTREARYAAQLADRLATATSTTASAATSYEAAEVLAGLSISSLGV